jgi:hypothetical protein
MYLVASGLYAVAAWHIQHKYLHESSSFRTDNQRNVLKLPEKQTNFHIYKIDRKILGPNQRPPNGHLRRVLQG